MPDLAIHPPIHVVTHPDEPIRSVEAAAKFVRRHMEGRLDAQAEALARELETASTPEEADRAGRRFAAWTQASGLLLVPPEDAAGR